MNNGSSPTTIYLKDYTPPAWLIDSVDLTFELGEENTLVRSRLAVRRNPDAARQDLVLDGEEMELAGLWIDGEAAAPGSYARGGTSLTLTELPDACALEIHTRIKPQLNTQLSGLYKSSGNFCTQCEAEGFRRITYFLDRPDVMAVYTVRIEADRARYPVLLSNGNRVEQGELPGNRHYAVWQDPFRKPCYLFALVAGDLASLDDTFVTRSGREVALRIFVEPENADQVDHAMASLKRAMKWDEDVFGLEYDLDIYMIVAVNDFNMGAMENKGLNIFNSKFVLARPDTATDQDYEDIEAVIAHEYFHNWTGNRVTCRDWFQLSLKEGLTVFRDQEFTSDMHSRAVKRIEDVKLLRTHQFREDAGPMSHPVRPDNYVEINNFYTVTIYEKGAEVIRMMHTLLGKEGFRRGMDLYFARHDGQAVTCDDFVAAMSDANGRDLAQFKLWYSQAGTPALAVEGAYDAGARTYTLTVRQSCPATPGQPVKQPMHIPLMVGLLDGQGASLPLTLTTDGAPVAGVSRVLEVRQPVERFVFTGLDSPPVPSLLRQFSAPVKLQYDYADDELAFLWTYDPDTFNRWEAGQTLLTRHLLAQAARLAAGEAPSAAPALLFDAFARTLAADDLDPALMAHTLTLPAETYLAELMPSADPGAIHAAHRHLRRELAQVCADAMEKTAFGCDAALAMGRPADAAGLRALRNLVLGYLAEAADGDCFALIERQFHSAENMTDEIGALAILAAHDCAQREPALARFYDRWRHLPLVVDKWFGLQAASRLPGALDRVRALMAHAAFDLKNPNRVRALIGSFANGNPAHFHASDGSGYAFLADQVLVLDGLNPQVAARLAGALSHWRKYEPARAARMREQLARIHAHSALSRDVFEIVSKSLD